jgi:hypothetical protein
MSLYLKFFICQKEVWAMLKKENIYIYIYAKRHEMKKIHAKEHEEKKRKERRRRRRKM